MTTPSSRLAAARGKLAIQIACDIEALIDAKLAEQQAEREQARSDRPAPGRAPGAHGIYVRGNIPPGGDDAHATREDVRAGTAVPVQHGSPLPPGSTTDDTDAMRRYEQARMLLARAQLQMEDDDPVGQRIRDFLEAP